MPDFTGFPAETPRFLGDLAGNNNKAWFDANRAAYDEYWVAPAKQFVDAVGEALVDIAPRIEAQPRVNGSIFRVNRDIRFSKDKRPYKEHLDFWFWEGERKRAVSGFFMRITPPPSWASEREPTASTKTGWRPSVRRWSVRPPDLHWQPQLPRWRRRAGRYAGTSTSSSLAATRRRRRPRSASSNTVACGPGRTDPYPPHSTTGAWCRTS